MGRTPMQRRRWSGLGNILKHSLIVLASLVLASCVAPATAGGSYSPSGSDSLEATLLIDMARADLQRKLVVDATKIAVQSARPLMFTDLRTMGGNTGLVDRQGECLGYIITLLVGNSTYEYRGRVIGPLRLLWRQIG
jgi:hypothetical protein